MDVTPEQYAAQRHPVRGHRNPERMDRPVWAWLVREGISAWAAAQKFDAPSALAVGPGWCFDRFGCSSTPLPDGRVLRIAGEHEDHYDPDFYIYNDVIVLHPGGDIEIFGYPEDAFPATDFHSATLVGESVWIVGNLGYPDRRQPGLTQVCRLSLDTFAIEQVETTGEGPGWLHAHTATLTEGGIVVSRGIVERDGTLHDNIDDWRLDLSSLARTRLTPRPFQSWSVSREDGEPLMYWELSQYAWHLEHPDVAGGVDFAEQLGPRRAHFDRDLVRQLFEPPLDHQPVEPSDDDDDADNTRYDTAQLCVGDALVRYDDTRTALVVKIERRLSEDDTRILLDDLTAKLSALQGAPCHARRTS